MLVLSVVQLDEVQTDNRLHPMQDCREKKRKKKFSLVVLVTKQSLPMSLM